MNGGEKVKQDTVAAVNTTRRVWAVNTVRRVWVVNTVKRQCVGSEGFAT
jgi:hypothetical protein